MEAESPNECEHEGTLYVMIGCECGDKFELRGGRRLLTHKFVRRPVQRMRFVRKSIENQRTIASFGTVLFECERDTKKRTGNQQIIIRQQILRAEPL